MSACKRSCWHFDQERFCTYFERWMAVLPRFARWSNRRNDSLRGDRRVRRRHRWRVSTSIPQSPGCRLDRGVGGGGRIRRACAIPTLVVAAAVVYTAITPGSTRACGGEHLSMCAAFETPAPAVCVVPALVAESRSRSQFLYNQLW